MESRLHLVPCPKCAFWFGTGPGCRECEAYRNSEAGAVAYYCSVIEAKNERLRHLRSMGRPPRVALVGCGKAKREGVHPACDLYVGNIFKWSYSLARRTCDETFILSAKHGLLLPDDRVESYDFSLFDLRLSERHRWGFGVIAHLATLFPTATEVQFTFFAGSGYVDPVLQAAREERVLCWEWNDPMRGMDLFERMKWLALQRELQQPTVHHQGDAP